jgi:HEAT repeat protein
MTPLLPVVLGLLVADPAAGAPPAKEIPPAGVADVDLANLQDLLRDRQDPRSQSQAALVLVQSDDPGAEKIVRRGLRHPEEEECFLALTAAVRLCQDRRFVEELLAVLTANRPRVRQVVAETLAVLPEPALVRRLEAIVADARADLRVRQTALWALGRTGRQQAASVLVATLACENDDLRRVAIGALADLTGQSYGNDLTRWRAWWARHKDMTAEQWLHLRLAFQTNRALRLEGDLARARAQVLRLHQQLYSRLPVAERFTHLQTLLEQEDPAVRGLAIVWALELLPAADAARQKVLAGVLLRLTNDSSPEVRRAAVLGLGHTTDPAGTARLYDLLKGGTPLVRAAAARSLAQQARGTTPAARLQQKEAIPALQNALEDRALEVVVEAAEALGTLGAPEAGPVLTGLLRHPSEHVRQTAAQALERMADASLIDGLLKGLDDPSVTVRFSLVGALSRAAQGAGGEGAPAIPPEGKAIAGEQSKRMMARLEALLERDADAGVRSRAATVIGERGGPVHLDTLWRVVRTSAEGRVQEKAWDAFVEILGRGSDPKLLERWDRALAEARQGSRRVQLLARVYARWDQLAGLKGPATRALEALVQAQIDLGKWSAAAPLVQNLLSRNADGGEAARTRYLRWLLAIGELALKEGNRAEAQRVVQDARAYLTRGDALGEAFDKLEKTAKKE